MLDMLRDPDYLIKCIDTCDKKRDEEVILNTNCYPNQYTQPTNLLL